MGAVTGGATTPPTARDARDAVARRRAATTAMVEDAERIAATCRDIAGRFARGGRLLTFGNGTAAADAAHIAVEFVHPVIVGKQALPALSLVADPAVLTGIARRRGVADTVATSLRAHARPDDVAIGLSPDGDCVEVAHALAAARDRGLLTVALIGGEDGDGGAIGALPGLDHVLRVRSSDPAVVRELHVTMYHVLWELVHVFLEQPGALPVDTAEATS